MMDSIQKMEKTQDLSRDPDKQMEKAHSSYTYLASIYAAYRGHFEAAQERFPRALVRMNQFDALAELSGLRHFAGIKRDMLRCYEAICDEDVSDLIYNINTAPHIPELHDSYAYEAICTDYLLNTAIPKELALERENLRQRGYIVLGHAQSARRNERTGLAQRIVKAAMGDGKIYSDSYLSHVEKVFENAKNICRLQVRKLELETPYDAALATFTPGVSAAQYEDILETLFKKTAVARTARLKAQSKQKSPIPMPEFTLKQGQKLVDLVCDLLPIADKMYETYMLEGLPSMCMGNVATIRFSSNPMILLETTFHERIAHLTYRKDSDEAGGINGFHLDEARALSCERFLLREPKALKTVSKILKEAYGENHPAFSHKNLLKASKWVHADISDRTASDDLTYILQETIRARAELYVMNDVFDVASMPEFLCKETEQAFGAKDLNGYHIMRETFQWPLAMQGHLAAYPLGLVMAAGLHMAVKQSCGKNFADLSKGAESPYFKFMQIQVDAKGKNKSPKDIIEHATGKTFLDMRAIEDYLGV